MGGRGRGRGAGKSMSLNVEALGFGRGGDSMPTAHLQPPPLFPPLEQHPLPLEQSEREKYLIDLKQDFQTFMEDSPYFVKRSDAKKDIYRYSDKYKSSANNSADSGMILYFRMPEELRPKTAQSKKGKKKNKKAMGDLKSTFAELEKKEVEAGSGDEIDGAASDAGGNKSDDEDDDKEEVDEDVELDEDDLEEENDYCQEYFDNGEGFAADDDDNMDDGPTY